MDKVVIYLSCTSKEYQQAATSAIVRSAGRGCNAESAQ